MPNLLLISDNERFTEDLKEQLGLYSPQFAVCDKSDVPDIILIDEKTEMLNSLHVKYPHVPIFVFLPKGNEKPEKKNLIKYETKPVSLYTVINNINAAINLAANSNAGRLNFNKYELHPLNKEILNRRNNELIKLTEKEVAIIQYLYKIKGRIVTKTELLQEVWGYSPDASTHTIETHIYRLRQKVEHEKAEAQLILTEDGGYLLKR